jgi:formate dehydrogenase maturation protein FdhE
MSNTNVTGGNNKQLNKAKISIQECKTILNKNGENYSDEEVKEIRDFLYTLIEIDYSLFQKHMKAKAEQLMQAEEDEREGKVIQLNTNEISDTKEFRQAG